MKHWLIIICLVVVMTRTTYLLIAVIISYWWVVWRWWWWWSIRSVTRSFLWSNHKQLSTTDTLDHSNHHPSSILTVRAIIIFRQTSQQYPLLLTTLTNNQWIFMIIKKNLHIFRLKIVFLLYVQNDLWELVWFIRNTRYISAFTVTVFIYSQ